MLRTFLLVVAVALLAIGLVARLAGHAAATPMVIWGAVLLLAVLAERWRYRPPTRSEGGEWVKTDEQFIDPESGRPVHVLYNPRTGERRYGDSSDGQTHHPGDR